MLLSHHQNAGQNHGIKITYRSFENVVQFEYLGRTVTNQSLIQAGIKRLRNRLRVLEKMMLRRVFGLKRDKVIGGWRKLHNEVLHNMYFCHI
jgi:hypothetical protein